MKLTREKIREMILQEFKLIYEQQPKVRTAAPSAPAPSKEKPAVVAPVEKPVSVPPKEKPVPKPITKPVPKPEPEIKPQPEKQPEAPAQEMNKMQYQIWNTKMRMGQLDLQFLVKKFAESMHTFDIRVTKNTKDINKVRSYLTPAKGDLEALKGALEALEAEFKKLDKLTEE